MIKDTTELCTAIRTLQRHASTGRPSRVALSHAITHLADAVTAAPKRKKKEPPAPRELVNVGKLEQEGLAKLKQFLGFAVNDLGHEMKRLEDRVADNIADDYTEEDARKEAVSHVDPTETYGDIERGLDSLSLALLKIEDVTEEKDLTKAVEDFSKAVNKAGDWVENESVLKPALQALGKAHDLVPNALTGPGALRMLQQAFNMIADVCNMLGKTKVTAPRIPRALDPDDPRQMKLFSAATSRIGNPRELHAALQEVHALASQPNPSRQELAARLLHVADSLTL